MPSSKTGTRAHGIPECEDTYASIDAAGQRTFSQLKGLSDEELMAYLKEGHDDALAVLFDRYYRLIFSIAFKILRDTAEAEDIVQTVFFEIYRAMGQFNPEKGSTKVWMLQYAYHRSMNRRHYLNVRGFHGDQEIPLPDGIELPARPVRMQGLTPQESARLVEEALATLNHAQRTTLVLSFFEGLSMAEIARRMNETVVNVRHHYYRGLKKLRTLLCARPS